jgi:hypothetical protein
VQTKKKPAKSDLSMPMRVRCSRETAENREKKEQAFHASTENVSSPNPGYLLLERHVSFVVYLFIYFCGV